MTDRPAATETSTLDEWPPGSLEAVDECPACSSADHRSLYRNLRDRNFGTAPGQFELRSCIACSSLFLNPRPTRDAAWISYRSYYTHSDDDQPRGLRRLVRAVRNSAIRQRYGYELDPTLSRLVATLATPALRSPVVRWRAERSVRHLENATGPSTRLLDLGCGNGEFLELAEACGWRATGIDMDEQAVAIARERNLDAHVGEVEQAVELFSGETWDVVTMAHVVEHLHDPGAAIEAAAKLLRPGGRLWLATPNPSSLAHELFGIDWFHLDPPRHLVLFSPRALVRLVGEHGFSGARFHPTVPEPRSLRSSLALREGRDPINDQARMTATLGARLPVWLAATAARPDRSEELVISAVRTA